MLRKKLGKLIDFYQLEPDDDSTLVKLAAIAEGQGIGRSHTIFTASRGGNWFAFAPFYHLAELLLKVGQGVHA